MQTERVIHERIGELKDELIGLAREIHAHPEPGLAEHYACSIQTRLLKGVGFDVSTPVAGLDTAYGAAFDNGSPRVCYMAEYDALNGIGHGCGHNLIAAASVGASIALRSALKESGVAGSVVCLGTPGEEGMGGKVTMVKEGMFEGMDLALMAHPSSLTTPDRGRLGVVRRRVVFHGQSAHAAASPQSGRNALDALMLLFAGVNAWRQHLPDNTRLHGIVIEGGEAANIVPRQASCSFYLRGADARALDAMLARFEAIAQGAALMTATEAEIIEESTPYQAGRINSLLNSEYFSIAQRLGMEPVIGEPGRASSDFGDVANVLPAAHVYFGICRERIPGHSPEFARAANEDFAHQRMLLAAEALALLGWRFCSDAAFGGDVTAEFRKPPTASL